MTCGCGVLLCLESKAWTKGKDVNSDVNSTQQFLKSTKRSNGVCCHRKCKKNIFIRIFDFLFEFNSHKLIPQTLQLCESQAQTPAQCIDCVNDYLFHVRYDRFFKLFIVKSNNNNNNNNMNLFLGVSILLKNQPSQSQVLNLYWAIVSHWVDSESFVQWIFISYFC